MSLSHEDAARICGGYSVQHCYTLGMAYQNVSAKHIVTGIIRPTCALQMSVRNGSVTMAKMLTWQHNNVLLLGTVKYCPSRDKQMPASTHCCNTNRRLNLPASSLQPVLCQTQTLSQLSFSGVGSATSTADSVTASDSEAALAGVGVSSTCAGTA